MSAGVTFERVYRALKDGIGSGRFAPGRHLEPASLSAELNASITPVRDALHRLVGEGLVESPRSEGFRMPHVTEVALRHLYRWNSAILDLAVRLRFSNEPIATDGEPPDIAGRTEQVFLEIAARTASPEPLAAVARLNDRLRAVRQTELALIEDAAPELDRLAETLEDGARLRRRLASYHRRREKLVGEIVARLVASE